MQKYEVPQFDECGWDVAEHACLSYLGDLSVHTDVHMIMYTRWTHDLECASLEAMTTRVSGMDEGMHFVAFVELQVVVRMLVTRF